MLSNSICPAQTLNSTHAVQITALPNASFTASALQDSVTLSNTSTGGSAYIWNFGDSTADVTTNPGSYVYSNSGTYTIRLVASNSCGSDTAYQTVVVQVPVGNDDDYSLSDFVLYPNPSTGVYRIQLPAILQGKKLEAEVLDIGGKVLYREFIMGDAGAYIEMPELRASGTYLVRLHHAGKTYQSKLVIR
jgi:PKD repeat protein